MKIIETPTVRQVLMIVISLIIIGLIFPLGLGMVSIAGDTLITVPFNLTGQNETQLALSVLVDPAVLTMLTVLLPILAVIGITIGFLPRAG